MNKLSSLSIVIQVYNDEDTIGKVLDDALRVGKYYCRKLEILVVDDGSLDTSVEIIKKLQKRIPHIRLIAHKENKGFGETIKECYQEARYDYIFSLPGDRQIRSDVLRDLLTTIDVNDIVVGWRRDRHDSVIRAFQSQFYNRIIRLISRIPVHDVNSTKLIKKKVLKSIQLEATSAFVDGELLMKASRAGFTLGEIPIHHYPRENGVGGGGGGSLKTILPAVADLVQFIGR